MYLRSYALAEYGTKPTEDSMRELLNQLKTLEGVEQRSSISIIRELNSAIEKAQSSGYRVAAIHQEIVKVVAIRRESFKTLLYRVRKEAQINQRKIEVPVLSTSRAKTQTKEVKAAKKPFEFNEETATQRSKHKLAQFGKGK